MEITNASAEQIDEFRNALAVVSALTHNDDEAYRLARQLIRIPTDYVCALQALSVLLLHVIDSTASHNGDSDHGADFVLQQFIDSAATAIPHK